MKKRDVFSKLHPELKTLGDHEDWVLEELASVITAFNPELIIELGTWMAGVTITLHEACLGADLHTFDSNSVYRAFNYKGEGKFEERLPETELRKFIETCFSPKVHFHQGNIVKEGGHTLINELCESRARKFLYCDNGNKPFEVKHYGQMLRSGDMLGVHDWPRQVNYMNTDLSGFQSLEAFNLLAEANKWQTRLFIRE